MPGDSHDEGREDQRDEDALDHAQEEIRNDFEVLRNFRVVRLRQSPADEHADDHGDQNPVR